jgi:hypothetical protein
MHEIHLSIVANSTTFLYYVLIGDIIDAPSQAFFLTMISYPGSRDLITVYFVAAEFGLSIMLTSSERRG